MLSGFMITACVDIGGIAQSWDESATRKAWVVGMHSAVTSIKICTFTRTK
jgi:hypothetical protein